MREQIETQTKKEKTYEEIRKQAFDLFEKHRENILASHDEDLLDYLQEIPDEVREKYWGHGVTRGNEEDQLVSLISILETQSIVGYAGRLAGSSNYNAWTEGPAMIISKTEKELMIYNDGKPSIKKIKKDEGENQVLEACKADIGMVVLNDQYYSIYEDLKKMYPNIKIIKANQLPSELK